MCTLSDLIVSLIFELIVLLFYYQEVQNLARRFFMYSFCASVLLHKSGNMFNTIETYDYTSE